MNTPHSLLDQIRKLPVPADFFHGQTLPDGASLPDNIILFYSTYFYPDKGFHTRYSLMIPFDTVSYSVDDIKVELDFGDALLVFPYQYRNVTAQSSSGAFRLFITFDMPSGQFHVENSPVHKLPGEAWNLLQDLIAFYSNKNSLELSICLMRLLLLLVPDNSQKEKKKLSKLCTLTVGYINSNLNHVLRIKAIAQELHVSESNLRFVFQKEMGISVAKYIAEQRVNEAKSRLLTSSMSISEIACSCGYDSIYAFSHFFKNYTGISPRNFRGNPK